MGQRGVPGWQPNRKPRALSPAEQKCVSRKFTKIKTNDYLTVWGCGRNDIGRHFTDVWDELVVG